MCYIFLKLKQKVLIVFHTMKWQLFVEMDVCTEVNIALCIQVSYKHFTDRSEQTSSFSRESSDDRPNKQIVLTTDWWANVFN